MIKLNKEFFQDNEVLFVGYSGESSKNSAFSKQIYQTFQQNGIKVYPFNNKENGSYDIKIYHSLSKLPKIPKCAYLQINKDNAAKFIEQLSASGVKRILFQSRKNVDPQTLEKCKMLGMEAVIACPMMIFGTGIHRLHGFFSGVKR